MKAWLGLGSNLERPLDQVREAIKRLGEIDGVEILAASSCYQTSPWGDEKQDDFINAVVRVDTCLEPVELLGKIQFIEHQMGRQRSARRWGPRLIDIDLLLYGSQQIQSDNLEVPHPRMHQRAFVLVPLSELDPNLVIPGRGAVENCLKKVDCSGIKRLVNQDPG